MLKTVVQDCFQRTLLQTYNASYQLTRNTYILKRRWPVLLHKKGAKPRPLKAKDYVYDLVENTNIKKQEPVQVLLKTFVDGLGKAGDVLSLKPNFAYEKLLLPRLATYATPENILQYEARKKSVDEFSSKYAKRTMNVLSSQVLAVVMNMYNPWTIEPWHVRVSFRKAGICVPEYAIKLPDKPITGPSSDMQDKEFITVVTINNTEKVNVRCRIHLWTQTLKDRMPYVPGFWKMPAEPLFEEDRKLLKSMPGPYFKKKSHTFVQ